MPYQTIPCFAKYILFSNGQCVIKIKMKEFVFIPLFLRKFFFIGWYFFGAIPEKIKIGVIVVILFWKNPWNF